MKLSQIRQLLAIADKGSVRAAARHLDVSQPQLTRSMQELEHELGVTLFERGARGVALTAIGLRFLDRAKTINSEVRRAQEEIAQLRGDTAGTLQVCMSTVPHIALYPYALREFRLRYPDVMMDLRDGVFPTAEPMLRNGMLDCYVGPAPALPAGSDLVVEKLFDNTRVVMCRRGHPLSAATSLAQLKDAEWATTSVTHKAYEELGPLFAQHGLPPPRLVMRAHSALTYVTSIAYSDLLTMLPVQWADFDVTRDALDIIKVKEVLPAAPICIVRRADLPLTPAAEYFCDMIRRASAHLLQARAAARPGP
ncbi:transcriptional regulator, LysR family [Duganella sp. CF517]|uniref:LysR substrate-binding domain-containing protein n=1 Tax=Duganella sp. CF517 TaxID=1881038 RepID=UPI0008CAF4D4|nr:LysR substrate-binding domain-containing protein [Duganella sp. CF517]SEO08588.1 transcriptional regulator, LysR family [Duganella sp. CF517]